MRIVADLSAVALAAGAIFLTQRFAREIIDASREFNDLAIDPVFFGVGVPGGDGHPVMTIPGLFGNDWYLRPLHGWLKRTGYAPQASGLRRNNGRVAQLVADLAPRVAQVHREAGRPLTLIGHSLGGVIACAIARAHPEAVRVIVTLGAPLQSVAASPQPLVALYSRSDRIVRYPRALAPNGGRNIEITGSHGGMAFNAQVYRHLGTLLAER